MAAAESRSLYLLSKFAPNVVAHLGLRQHEWASVLDKRMDKRMKEIEERIAEAGAWEAPTTLVDLAFLAEVEPNGRGSVTRPFLRFVDTVVGELIERIPEPLRPSARKQFRDLFINLSTTESKYLDKVGELLATNEVLRTTGVELVGFEVKTMKGSRLDVVVRMPSGLTIPIEFLNIHLDDDRVESAEGLDAFLDGRIIKKVEQKKMSDIVDEPGRSPFPLLLIVWFKEVETMRQFGPGLVARAQGTELPICSILQLRDDADNPSWLFGSVQSLLARL